MSYKFILTFSESFGFFFFTVIHNYILILLLLLLFFLCCLGLYSFSFYLKINFYYFKLSVCGCAHEFRCQQRPEEDGRSTGAGVTGRLWAAWLRRWKQNWSLPQERCAPSTPEPWLCLRLLEFFIYGIYSLFIQVCLCISVCNLGSYTCQTY